MRATGSVLTAYRFLRIRLAVWCPAAFRHFMSRLSADRTIAPSRDRSSKDDEVNRNAGCPPTRTMTSRPQPLALLGAVRMADQFWKALAADDENTVLRLVTPALAREWAPDGGRIVPRLLGCLRLDAGTCPTLGVMSRIGLVPDGSLELRFVPRNDLAERAAGTRRPIRVWRLHVVPWPDGWRIEPGREDVVAEDVEAGAVLRAGLLEAGYRAGASPSRSGQPTRRRG